MKLSLAKKIAIPFGIILVLMAMMGISSVIGQNIGSEVISIVETETLKVETANSLRSNLASLLMAVNDYIITGKEQYQTDYENAHKLVQRDMTKLSDFDLSDEEQRSLDTIITNLGKVYGVVEQIWRLEHVRTNPRAAQLMEEMDYTYGESVYGQAVLISASVAGRVRSATIEMRRTDRLEFWIIVATSLGAFGISIGVVVLTMKRITGPIIELIRMAERITGRDFSVELVAKTKDEIGVLMIAFNTMTKEIRRRYEELESFAYIVAHDLKSPIAGILGMTEIVLSDFGDTLEAKGKEFLELTISSSKRMTSLINDLLEFARAGNVEFSKEAFSMNQMLNTLQGDLQHYIRERKASITVGTDLPAIYCDQTRFSQVWKNLVHNAIKYNENVNPRIEVGCDKGYSDTMYLFFVRDNGIGIGNMDLEQIFMPFKRGGSASKYEGTGIGLPIVKRVVELHGGKVWAESKAGEGTVFYFTIPKPLRSRSKHESGNVSQIPAAS